jgi:hypothetical protein
VITLGLPRFRDISRSSDQAPTRIDHVATLDNLANPSPMTRRLQTVHLRCYAELNAFLPEPHRHKAWPYRVSEGTSIADIAAALSIPAERIELVLVDSEEQDLTHVPADGARIALYPAMRTLTS